MKLDKEMADFEIPSHFAEQTSLGCEKYQVMEVPTINILLVGHNQAGKTTIVDTILNSIGVRAFLIHLIRVILSFINISYGM